MDYKIAVTVVQILGYLLAKFLGIKIISELRRESRLGFILLSVGIAETALVFFAVLPVPWNVLAMFFNGLALGCMWGVIFSFIEGRRVTDLLASLLGISMVVSSGTAKSVGLYVMSHFHVSEFWMPAVIGACALPLLCLLGYCLHCLPAPSGEDILRKFKKAVTDSDACVRFDPANKPGVSNLMQIYSVATGADFAAIEREFDGRGYGDFKQAVGEAVVELLRPIREETERLLADKTYLESVYRAGAEKAAYVANKTLNKVYKKVGFLPR